MKKLAAFLLLCAFNVGGYADTPQQTPTNVAPSANCTSLPADQQSFSLQLNPGNKAVFCNTFTMDQRKAAMSMMNTPDATGTKMTADQSVESIAKSSPMAPATQQKPGGCPVRQ